MWGSKPKPKEYSGFPGDTSPEQDQVCTQLKNWIAENKMNEIGEFDDVDMLRFCRARQFKLEDIQLMFGNFITWRREN